MCAEINVPENHAVTFQPPPVPTEPSITTQRTAESLSSRYRR